MNYTVFAKKPGQEMQRFVAFDVASHEEAVALVKRENPGYTVLVDTSLTTPTKKAPGAKFVKKPVVINAIEFIYSQQGVDNMREFCEGNLGDVTKERRPDAKAQAVISTLKDGSGLRVTHIATEGDWIIKSTQGELYACKPDIFNATYQAA